MLGWGGYIERCQARTEEKLKQAIKEAIDLLQKEDLTKYFKKCFNHFEERIDIKKIWRKKILPCWMSSQIKEPQEWFNAKIYPSWRWLRLGARPTLNKIKSAKKRIEDCFTESLK